MKQETLHFFLGCTAADGFWGCFDRLLSPQSGLVPYLIKAGPGCGKSGMMRRIGEKLEAMGYGCEYIHCGSDPASLDGLICRRLHFALLDATAPHALEPTLPAAAQQVVSLYDCLDAQKLPGLLQPLRETAAQRAAAVRSAGRLMGAAAALYEDICRCAGEAVQQEKLLRYLRGLCSRELPRGGTAGSEQLRLCTNFTPQGFVDFRTENFSRCRRILFCDRYGAVSSAALQYIRRQALQNGCSIVSCPDPLAPDSRLCAVWLPQQQLCFLADGPFGRAPRQGAKLIHTARFCSGEKLAAMRGALRSSSRSAEDILQQACAKLEQARRLHLQCERHYTAAMDFEKLQQKERALFEQILRAASV